MANRLYNQQVSPKGYKRGGGVTDQTKKSESKPKKKNIIQKLRKKFLPTFDEQFDKAKKEGKKTFTSTRDNKTKGKLEYHTRTKAEEDKAKKKYTTLKKGEKPDKIMPEISGKTSKKIKKFIG